MQNTFTAHYTGNRQPIGLYTHPVHLSVRPRMYGIPEQMIETFDIR